MRKKRWALASLAVAGAMIFSCTACSSLFTDVKNTTPFEVATELGYDGSEASWLAAQYGASQSSIIRAAYDEAVKEGFNGTFLEFLERYLTVSTDDSAAVNQALRSVVSVTAEFTEGGQKYASGGSGVFYKVDTANDETYVITNYHVVYYAKGDPKLSNKIDVTLYGGTQPIKATYVGGAMNYDIAVLKLENSDVLKKSSAIGANIVDSDSITVGEKTYAIGNPAGEGFSVSNGIVSVDAEYIDIMASDETTVLKLLEIRTDAPINHGNSGGGLFNAQGQLIGIVNARSEQSGVEQLGYAIPTNLAITVVQNILDNRSQKAVACAKMGTTMQVTESHSVFDEATQKNYISETVKVAEVSRGGAMNGRLEAGDIIHSITVNGKEYVINRMYQIENAMLKVRKGNTVTFKIKRGDNPVQSFDVTYDKDEYFTKYD